MIGSALAGVLACVPLAQADAFGEIRFDEPLQVTDARLVDARCSIMGCAGRDRSGVRYDFLEGAILIKTVDGTGPSDQFRPDLRPMPGSRHILTAAVCTEATWVQLTRERDGSRSYGVFAQP